MREHVVVATRRLLLHNVGPPLLGLSLALEPEGAGMAAVCPTRYADDTEASRLAPHAAPMSQAPAVTRKGYGWPTRANGLFKCSTS